MQSRMRQHDPGKFRQSLARRRLQIVFPEREQYVRHVHLQAAGRVRRRQHSIELIQQRRAQSLLLRFRLRRRFLCGLLALCRSICLLLCRLRLLLRCQSRRIRLRSSRCSLRRISLRLQFLDLSLLTRCFFDFSSRVRRSHRRLRCCLFGRGLLLRRALQSDCSRVGRRLHCIARRRDHFLPARFLRKQTLRLCQRAQRLLISIRRQRVGSRALRDGYRVARLVYLQRHLRGKFRDRFPRLPHVVRISAALHQLVIPRHLLRRSHRIHPHHILQHHHIARHAHREIRLRRPHHPQTMQIRRRRQFALVAVQLQFPQIIRLALRRDRPQHVRQIFFPELLCRLHILETRAHYDRSLLAVHLRVALRQRQQRRPLKPNHR